MYSLPDVFQARAVIYVDTESALRPLLRGLAVETDVMSQVTLMSRALLSRPNIEKVARATDLDLRAKSEQEREQLYEMLQRKIQIGLSNRENLFTVGYEDQSRETAELVVRELIDTFVEDALGTERSESNTAERFLVAQVKEYERRLTEAENRLAEFKKANVGLLPGEGGGYYARLQTATEALSAIDRKLDVASRRKDALERQLQGEEPVFGLSPGQTTITAPSSFDSQISATETQLASLRLRFTDRHPDVIAAERVLEDLKRKRREEHERLGVTSQIAGTPGLEQNEVYQQLKLSRAQVNVEIASLQAERRAQAAEVAELRNLVDTVPEVEAQLQRLNRDYDVVQSQHQQLMSRLESARLSDDVQSSEDVKFRIIEPPLASLLPVGPNRPVLLGVAFVIALGAGIAMAFIRYYPKPVFNTAWTLRAETQVPVLGMIPMVRTATVAREHRRNLGLLAFSLFSLVIMFGAVTAFQSAGSELVRSLLESL